MSHPTPAITHWRAAWNLRPDTTYLNHGSFGPPPRVVQQAREAWQRQLDEQPMDFFVRRYETAWFAARDSLAAFLDSPPESLVFVENATAGMNLVADSFPLAAGDEIILTDHEYGAVFRIWQRKCAAVGATLVTAVLPWPMTTAEEITAAIMNCVTSQTKLVVVSHITSPTAVILPVAAIAAECRARDVAVCIDGPHAPLQVELSLRNLACDFYVASCHKWLCAPFGSGFFYAAPRWQPAVRCDQLSWGRLPPLQPERWFEEFIWSGTRDSAPYFSIPAAIAFAQEVGEETFRQQTHALAKLARTMLEACFPHELFVPDDATFYGSMALVALPPGEARRLQCALWERFQIEVPIVPFRERRFVRVSCHLYNDPSDLEKLTAALQQLVQQEGI